MGKMLLSPEYKLIEIFENTADPNFAIRNLWEDIAEINLFESVPKLDVPVYFIAGEHDYNTPSELVEQYYNELEAPEGKHLIWFDNAAHLPEFEDPNLFYSIMVDSVLAQTFPPSDAK